jgi:membrane-associated HD superfamily phosphohydrolase
MGQDLAHRRPWLAASLLFGLTFPLSGQLAVPGLLAMLWKMAGVGFLVPFMLRRHHEGQFVWAAAFLALYALADGVLEQSVMAGGAIFAVGHVVAIALFLRHRRPATAPSQRAFATVMVIATPLIVWLLVRDAAATLYALIVATMAAAAWSSNFPRYRVGMGAVLFVASDIILIAQMGPLAGWAGEGFAVWYLYFSGVLLMAMGIAQTLVKRGHFPVGEEGG